MALQFLLSANKQYFSTSFCVRYTTKFYTQTTELFKNLSAGAKASNLNTADRIDQKIAKLITYIIGTYCCSQGARLLYSNFTDEKIEVDRSLTYRTALIANYFYYLSDVFSLLKPITPESYLFAHRFVEVIKGPVQIILGLASIKFQNTKYINLPADDPKKSFTGLILSTIFDISKAAEGALLIAKSRVKIEGTMLKNSLLIAGITQSIFLYLFNIYSAWIRKR